MLQITQKIIASLLGVLLGASLTSCRGSNSSSESQTSSQEQNLHQGVAQKGPFATESVVTITPLGLLGNPAAISTIQTKTDSTSGSFKFEASQDWSRYSDSPLYEIKITGLYFDESSGSQSNQPIQLSTITTNINQSSVNLLTNWQAVRTKVHLQQGKTPQQSMRTSEVELAKILGINNSHRLNFTQSEEFPADNAMLLLLSGSLLDVAHQNSTDPQVIIDAISLDFSDDGKLTSSGKSWLKRIQANIMSHPVTQANLYSARLKQHTSSNTVSSGRSLPKIIRLASKPSAIIPSQINAQPGETITLDAGGSHDHGSNNITYTWFRIDQNTEYDIPFSNRFIANPTITLPNSEVDLLFSVIVSDNQNLTDTAVTKVTVKNTDETNNAPVAVAQNLTTPEDTPINITLAGTDQDNDPITNYIIATTPIILNNGILDINGSLPNLKYTPSQNAFGNDSFTFQVSDGDKISPTATINISITPVVDDPPTADYFIAMPAYPNVPVAFGTDFETGTTLRLDGSNSSDPDDYQGYDDIVSYSWKINGGGYDNEIVSGSTTEISPESLPPFSVTVKLTVTDSSGSQNTKTNFINFIPYQ